VTAEYGMLPRSTHTRSAREAARGKQSGRTLEIQRLIGRSLRAVVDLRALGERTVTLDCDVLQADGGTRTAAITGAYVALADAMDALLRRRAIGSSPLHGSRGSVGRHRGRRCRGRSRLRRDSSPRPTERGDEQRRRLHRVQGTAEGHASAATSSTSCWTSRRGLRKALRRAGGVARPRRCRRRRPPATG